MHVLGIGGHARRRVGGRGRTIVVGAADNGGKSAGGEEGEEEFFHMKYLMFFESPEIPGPFRSCLCRVHAEMTTTIFSCCGA